jgi:hypothetical protein
MSAALFLVFFAINGFGKRYFLGSWAFIGLSPRYFLVRASFLLTFKTTLSLLFFSEEKRPG